MSVAFFDLDNTLLAVNSGVLWVRRELALGLLRKRDAVRVALWLVQYRLGLASAWAPIEKAIMRLQGTSAEDLHRQTVHFFETVLRQTFRPGGREAVQMHRTVGDRLVLLTSTSHYLAELVATELGLHEVICNRFEITDEGNHTGRIVGQICFGPGKLSYAQATASKWGVPLNACTFYTDSFSDVSVLERVGRPVAVNPDLRLKLLALHRGWMVADWGKPKP